MLEDGDKIRKEENLSDIVFSDAEKSEKTKKFMFSGIIIAVVVVIIFAITTTFTTEDEVVHSNDSMEFLNDQDPFFMDSPADAIEPLTNEANSEDEPALQEDNYFSKDSILESDETVAEESQPTSVEATSLAPKSSLAPTETTGTSILNSSDNSEPTPLVQQTLPVDRTPIEKSQPTTGERSYYIQTGTFFKLQPNKKFLQGIEALGLSYSIDMYVKDGQEIRRVLVGPFEDKESAKKALTTVKEKIAKDAYILKTRMH
jgi:cell division protein FtsN